jgi:hypothetical protein
MLLLLLACAPSWCPDGACIRLVSPVEDDVVCGSPLEVVTEVQGLTLVDPYEEGGDPAEGTGHIDSYLNGQNSIMSGEPDFEIPDVADGLTQLKVELSKADHTAIEPYAGDFLYITVDSSACGS